MTITNKLIELHTYQDGYTHYRLSIRQGNKLIIVDNGPQQPRQDGSRSIYHHFYEFRELDDQNQILRSQADNRGSLSPFTWIEHDRTDGLDNYYSSTGFVHTEWYNHLGEMEYDIECHKPKSDPRPNYCEEWLRSIVQIEGVHKEIIETILKEHFNQSEYKQIKAELKQGSKTIFDLSHEQLIQLDGKPCTLTIDGHVKPGTLYLATKNKIFMAIGPNFKEINESNVNQFKLK